MIFFCVEKECGGKLVTTSSSEDEESDNDGESSGESLGIEEIAVTRVQNKEL